MIKVIFFSCFSILFENVVNLYLSSLIYFTPLFTLISLIFANYYLSKNKIKYYIYSSLLGIIYDIFFTNFYVLNSLLFLICAIFIYYIFKRFKFKLLSVIFVSIFIILLYNLLTFFVLNFFMYTNYSLLDFCVIVKHFLIGNVIYSIIMYLIIKLINKCNI